MTTQESSTPVAGPSVALAANPAPRETLQDFVYARLKDLILDGDLAPGRTITIASLAATFSVSPMPVREALNRLTAERALTVVAGRSMGVPALTLPRLEDLRRVRTEVEGMAAAWAATRISPETLARLAGLRDDLDAAAARGDARLYLHSNRALHFAIYREAGSPTLTPLIESLWLQISPYFNLLHGSGNFAEANRSHLVLIEALARADADAARAAIHSDIDASAAALRGLLAAP